MLGLLPARRLRAHRRRGSDHRQAAHRVDGVGRPEAELPDQQPAEAGADDRRHLVQAEVQRQRRAHALGRHEVGHDRPGSDVLHAARAGHEPAEDVQHRHRRRAGEGQRGEGARAGDERDLVEQQQPLAIHAVGDRPAQQRRGDERRELDGSEQAGEEGGAGLRVELVGQRDERRLRPEARDELAHGEQPQIARVA
jgi:hypothetical protein